MTRLHALTMLLRLGPLSYGELREITGWRPHLLDRALAHACRPRGTVRRLSSRRRVTVYRAATPQELASRPARRGRGPNRSRRRIVQHRRSAAC